VKFDTVAARGGRDLPSASRPLTPPIYQTNVYVFEDMEMVESVWEGKKAGYVYGRYGTGNHTMLEELVAAFEGAEAAVACASGMGATTAWLLGLDLGLIHPQLNTGLMPLVLASIAMLELAAPLVLLYALRFAHETDPNA